MGEGRAFQERRRDRGMVLGRRLKDSDTESGGGGGGALNDPIPCKDRRDVPFFLPFILLFLCMCALSLSHI